MPKCMYHSCISILIAQLQQSANNVVNVQQLTSCIYSNKTPSSIQRRQGLIITALTTDQIYSTKYYCYTIINFITCAHLAMILNRRHQLQLFLFKLLLVTAHNLKLCSICLLKPSVICL